MINKRVAVILMIVALILASLAIVTLVVQSNDAVSTGNLGDAEDNGNGKVGVTILPSSVEDKGDGG